MGTKVQYIAVGEDGEFRISPDDLPYLEYDSDYIVLAVYPDGTRTRYQWA